MLSKFFDGIFKTVLVVGAVFFIAFIAGAAICGNADAGENAKMYEFLNSFFGSAKALDSHRTAMAALGDYLKIFGIIFVCAFFKPGAVVKSCVVARQGFVSGYTLASFFKVFSARGILAMLCQLPELVLFATVLLIFSSTSTKMSFFSSENKKNFLLFFIIFSCFCGSIFCALGFFKGYLTTTFMKWASVKIL